MVSNRHIEQPPTSDIDRGAPASLQVFILEPDHLFVRIWKNGLYDMVMEIVRTREDWQAVDVLRLGYHSLTAEENPITIIITTRKVEENHHSWKMMALSLHELCSRVGLLAHYSWMESQPH
jgi:hypothetical protein